MDILRKIIEQFLEELEGTQEFVESKIDQNVFNAKVCLDCKTQIRLKGRCLFWKYCDWSSCT